MTARLLVRALRLAQAAMVFVIGLCAIAGTLVPPVVAVSSSYTWQVDFWLYLFMVVNESALESQNKRQLVSLAALLGLCAGGAGGYIPLPGVVWVPGFVAGVGLTVLAVAGVRQYGGLRVFRRR